MPSGRDDGPRRPTAADPDTSSDWWQEQLKKEKERRIRLEVFADTLGARAEQVQDILARDSETKGEQLALVREILSAVRDLRDDFEAIEDTLTALRIHCSTTTGPPESGETPLPPENVEPLPLDADRRRQPRTIREAIAQNVWILLVIVALLGSFALVGVRIVLPGLASSEPPPDSGSHSAPDSPRVLPSSGDDDEVEPLL